jgi:murein DD-endopeptidase MepM/ murein hydrolase activator NlpD
VLLYALPMLFPRADITKLLALCILALCLPGFAGLGAYAGDRDDAPPGTAGISAAGEYPTIARLDVRDLAFKQYLDAVERSRRVLFSRNRTGFDPAEAAEGLLLFSYLVPEGEDIFRLASRCNVPYAALATLNRAGHPSSMPKKVLLPSVPGIFIPEHPENDLERLMASGGDREGVVLTIGLDGKKERFLFIPGVDFSPTERTYFLNTGFRFPLRTYRLTSAFGVRASPFTGKPQNHSGLDLAAPLGTEVYAARDGVVSEMGTDSVYGNYIIIAHEDKWVSLYGHLSSFNTSLHSRVRQDSVIGRVGSTGLSTGPHLHFELRKNGTAMDPGKLLFQK